MDEFHFLYLSMCLIFAISFAVLGPTTFPHKLTLTVVLTVVREGSVPKHVTYIDLPEREDQASAGGWRDP